MTTNPYFNNFAQSQEQSLVEDLVIESIKQYGMDMYYIPKTQVSFDGIYGEDDQSEYRDAILVELYIRNVNGFGGDGNFLSKFGLEIRDQITFTIARRVFTEEIGNSRSLERPREGDLIYFPLSQKIYQIKFVDHLPVFYQFGSLQMYDLRCELFEYSSEKFSTGITEIDSIYIKYTTDALDANSSPIATTDPIADNTRFEAEANAVLNFGDIDPFSATGTY